MIDMESFQEIVTDGQLERVHLKISTAKGSDLVLLKIVAA